MKPVVNTLLLILSILFVFLPPSALADDPPPGYPPPIPAPYPAPDPDPWNIPTAVNLLSLHSAESAPLLFPSLTLLFILCVAVIWGSHRQGRRLP